MNRLIQRNFSSTARLLRVEKNIITPAKENAGMPKPGEIVRVHYTGKSFLERKFSMLPTKWVASLASLPFFAIFPFTMSAGVSTFFKYY